MQTDEKKEGISQAIELVSILGSTGPPLTIKNLASTGRQMARAGRSGACFGKRQAAQQLAGKQADKSLLPRAGYFSPTTDFPVIKCVHNHLLFCSGTPTLK